MVEASVLRVRLVFGALELAGCEVTNSPVNHGADGVWLNFG